MKIIFFITVLVLVGLLILSLQRNSAIAKEKERVVQGREILLEIAKWAAGARDPIELYQFILDSCLKLMPKVKFGTILMSSGDGFLAARASVGFNREEISKLKLRPEDTVHYMATNGKMDHTVIINNLIEFSQKSNVNSPNPEASVVRSEISTPLRINGELAGILSLNGDQNGIFSEQDAYILDFVACHIGIVLRNQRLYSEIQHLSKFDGLTDLLNRDTFDQEAEKLINDPSKDAASLFFVLMDLDELKAANDANGHYFGNEVIKAFSELIKRCLGKNDLCGRYGGDEFAAIIQGDQLNISHMLEDANIELSEHKIGLLTNDFIPSFSYGMASFREANNDLDSLYQLADSRLRDAKRVAKRNRDALKREANAGR